MTLRFACLSLLMLTVALPAGTLAVSTPGEAAQSMYRENRFGRMCKAPLKFAAGACVRRCPAGYRDTGRGYCSFRRMSK